MNKVELVGRITRDVEMRVAGQTSVAQFTVAVQRKFKNKDGKYDSDFISCKAFGKTAEFIEKFFHKGDPIELTGNIQTGSYEKDGHKVYTTDVIVDDAGFVPGATKTSGSKPANNDDMGFVNIPDKVDEELPFN